MTRAILEFSYVAVKPQLRMLHQDLDSRRTGLPFQVHWIVEPRDFPFGNVVKLGARPASSGDRFGTTNRKGGGGRWGIRVLWCESRGLFPSSQDWQKLSLCSQLFPPPFHIKNISPLRPTDFPKVIVAEEGVGHINSHPIGSPFSLLSCPSQPVIFVPVSDRGCFLVLSLFLKLRRL